MYCREWQIDNLNYSPIDPSRNGVIWSSPYSNRCWKLARIYNAAGQTYQQLDTWANSLKSENGGNRPTCRCHTAFWIGKIVGVCVQAIFHQKEMKIAKNGSSAAAWSSSSTLSLILLTFFSGSYFFAGWIASWLAWRRRHQAQFWGKFRRKIFRMFIIKCIVTARWEIGTKISS